MGNAAGYDDLPEEQTRQLYPGVYVPRGMPDLDALLRAMHGRYSSNPIDKVWAIAFPFQRRQTRGHVAVTLPIYNTSTPASVAWGRLISTMASTRMDVTPPIFDLSISFWPGFIEMFRRIFVKFWEENWKSLWRILGKRFLKMILKQALKQLWKQPIPSVASAKMDVTTLIYDPGTLVSVFWQQLWEQLWKRRPWNQPWKRLWKLLWKLLWKQLWKRLWGRLIPINATAPRIQGTLHSVGLGKGMLVPFAWDTLWKQLRKQVWGQFWNLPVHGPGVPHSLALIWKQLWKRLWKQLWKRYWKPMISIGVGKYGPVVLDRREKLWGPAIYFTPRFYDPTWVSGGLTVQQSPTVQLLRLFPHPSRHHWFPSWTQVQQYPDVSVRDNDQGDDLVFGNMDYSLRIMSGRIYRSCSLQLTQPPTPEKKAMYCSTIDGKDAQLEATVPGIDLNIDSRINYVLVDISPDSSLWPLEKEVVEYSNIIGMLDCCQETDIEHDHLPIWQKSVVLVCEEVDTIAQSKADNALVSEGPLATMRYCLRRVTTLEWNCRQSATPADTRSPRHWLPFQPSLVHMRSVVCSATGGLHSISPWVEDPDVFCDPGAVTGLWSEEGWQQEWHKRWPFYEVYLV